MLTFSVKVKSIQRIPELRLTDPQTRVLSNLAIKSLVDRVQQKHTDVYDIKMPAYSKKPIYVKLGFAGGRAVLKSGRVPIATLASLKKRGAKIIDGRGSKTSLKGATKKAIVRTDGYVRFPNRATYKRYLGRSGERDLTETGAMLDAIVLISTSGIYAKVITIGFKDSKQASKAAGNTRWAGDWLGLAPSDERKIQKVVEKMLGDNLGVSLNSLGLRTTTITSS